MVKVKANAKQREGIIGLANIFRASVIDVAPQSLMVEIVGSQDKIDAFLDLLNDYEILELARTGIAALARGIEHVLYIEDDGTVRGWTEHEKALEEKAKKEQAAQAKAAAAKGKAKTGSRKK